MTRKDIVKAAQTLDDDDDDDDDDEDGEIPAHTKPFAIPTKAIALSSTKRQKQHFVPLELRKEKKDGIGRPKGDRGREGFVGNRGILDWGQKTFKKKKTKEYVAYGDARKDPPTTAEAAHASNLAFVKRIPDGAKPKLLKEVTFVLSKSNTKGGIKTVPNAVRYKCLYRLTAIRLANVDVAREDTVKVKEMVEEVERVECECFEASNGNKSTYLSKVAQFTKSNEFEKVTEEMFLPKGSMLQERRSETASKIDLAFCTFVRGSENIKFFRKAAKRARGEFAEDVIRDENNDSLDVREEEEEDYEKEEEHKNPE